LFHDVVHFTEILLSSCLLFLSAFMGPFWIASLCLDIVLIVFVYMLLSSDETAFCFYTNYNTLTTALGKYIEDYVTWRWPVTDLLLRGLFVLGALKSKRIISVLSRFGNSVAPLQSRQTNMISIEKLI
jgi:hypothetical protein